MQLVDREQAEHVDAALQTMKESLQVLREPSQVALMIMMMNLRRKPVKASKQC